MPRLGRRVPARPVRPIVFTKLATHGTRLYLHAAGTADAGTLPGAASLSTAGALGPAFAGEAVNRDAGATPGAGQTTASGAVATAKSALARRFLSAPLAAQEIPQGSWQLRIAAATTAGPSFISFGVYLWRPSTGTKIATIVDDGGTGIGGPSFSSASEVALTVNLTNLTFIQGATAQDGDVLVLEVYVFNNNASTQTISVYYDGTTEDSASSNAAVVVAPVELAFLGFASYPVTASDTGASVSEGPLLRVVGRVLADTGAAISEPAGTLDPTFIGQVGTSQVGTGNPVITVGAAGVAAGHHLLLSYFTQGASAVTALAVTDSKGNTYQVDQIVDDNTGATHAVAVSAKITTALVSGDTITASPTGGGVQRTLVAEEWANLAGSGWAEATAVGNGTSTAPATAALTASAKSVVMATVAYNLAANNYTPSSGNERADLLMGTSAGRAGAVQDEIRTSSGSFAPSGTLTSSVVWVMVAASYLAAAGGSGAITASVVHGRTAADTGSTVSDALGLRVARPFAETGASVSDSAQLGARSVSATDTGASLSETLRPAVARPLADTGASLSDSLAGGKLIPRTAADTGASVSDTLASSRTRAETDAGAAVSDSLASSRTRVITPADAGASLSDSLASRRTRPLADTGATVNDSSIPGAIRAVADTGATVSETLRPRATRPLADTGASLSELLALRSSRPLADIGSSISDALARSVARPLADAGASVSESAARSAVHPRAASDTGTAVSEALTLLERRPLADTGAAVSDSVSRFLAATRALSESGATVTDSASGGRSFARAATDTGTTASDTLKRTLVGRAAADTGATVADTASRGVARRASDTGAAITDSAVGGKLLARAAADYGVARAPITDTFTRTTASGWGTSDSGDAWTVRAGTASEFSTNGSVAQIATAVVNSSRFITAASAADVDLTVRLALSAVPAGAASLASIPVRWVDVNNHYRAWLNWTTAGAVQLRLEKIVGGAITVLTTQPNVVTGYVGGSFVWVRFQAIGSELRAKAWADGSSEPSSWAHDVFDRDIAAPGPVGVRLFHSTGSTNTPTLSVDDLTATPSLGDSLGLVWRHAPAETGAAISDSLATARARRPADTGAAVADTVARTRAVPRAPADTGASLAESLALRSARPLADAGAALSDQLARPVQQRPTDVGAALADSAARSLAAARSVADIGASLADGLGMRAPRALTDQGAAPADDLRRGFSYLVLPLDDGAAVADLLAGARLAARVLAEAGAAIGDTVLAFGLQPLADPLVVELYPSRTAAELTSDGRTTLELVPRAASAVLTPSATELELVR